ncbi:MAG TPA: DUF2062 domain-containing protein [Nitrospirota bacterium]
MTPTRIRERLRHILHLDETPHELAKAFAFGVFVAFTPSIGFHTATVLILAWAFRLNKAVALTGTFINNPWTIAFVYIGPTWIAAVALRKVGFHVPPLGYEALSTRFMYVVDQYSFWQREFWITLREVFRPYFVAFFAGTIIAGVVAGFSAYFLSYIGIKYYRIEKAKLHELKEKRRHRQ